MSFQAYLDSIEAKTGMKPEQFRAAAKKAGLLHPKVKAAELTGWLAKEHGLGLGHARALWEVFKREGWVETSGGTGRAKAAGPKAGRR